MQEFALVPDEVQVRGTVLDTFVSAFGAYKNRGQRILSRALGADEINIGEADLYSLNDYLAAMRDIQDQFGRDFMRRIGSFIFDKAVFPPGIETLVQSMSLIGTAYYMNHVDAEGKIGGYHWTQVGERNGVMKVDCPYPCAFDLGIISTIAGRFESTAKVAHDDSTPCRNRGGDVCTYTVEW